MLLFDLISIFRESVISVIDHYSTDGVFGTAGPKADSSFSKKMNKVIIEVYGMSTCIHECMTAI